jgi:hypothetical protein
VRTRAETLSEISLEEYAFQMFEYKLVFHCFIKTHFLGNVRHCLGPGKNAGTAPRLVPKPVSQKTQAVGRFDSAPCDAASGL